MTITNPAHIGKCFCPKKPAASSVSDWDTADHYLRHGRSPHSRPLCNNTRILRLWNGDIGIRLHSTVVVVYPRPGWENPPEIVAWFTLGGWNTVTTRDRVKGFTPARLGTQRKVPYVRHPDDPLSPSRIRKCGECKGEGLVPRGCMGSYMCAVWPCNPPHWRHHWIGPGVGADGEPCEHGFTDRHKVCRHGYSIGHEIPCEHGEYDIHKLDPVTCYRCEGEGQAEYGRKPQPTWLTKHEAVAVDSTGRVVSALPEYPMDIRVHELARVPYTTRAAVPGGVSVTKHFDCDNWDGLADDYPLKKFQFQGPSFDTLIKDEVIESELAVANNHVAQQPEIDGSRVQAQLGSVIPDIGKPVGCPAHGPFGPYYPGCRDNKSLSDMIIHLNDLHYWSREGIADWLESLDLDLELRERSMK